MSHIIPAHGTRPWRILILDRDPADPKWVLATVVIPSDVRRPCSTPPPATLASRPPPTGWPSSPAAG